MNAVSPKVLYLEDNEDDWRQVAEILPEPRYSVEWAKTAAEARARLQHGSYDLLLLDHSLPDTNSLLFMEEVLRDRPAMPVIVFTGREDDALAVAAIQKGARMLLLKDAMMQDLRPAVEETTGMTGDAPARKRELTADRAEVYLAGQITHLHHVLLSTMNDGCLLIDVDGTVTFANEAAGRITGCRPNDLLGRPIRDLLDRRTWDRFSRFNRSAAQTSPEDAWTFEGSIRLSRPDDVPKTKPVLFSVRDMDNILGKHVDCLVLMTDISELIKTRNALHSRLAELKRYQVQLSKANARLKELDGLKNQFVSIVTHDLRAPVTAIKGSVENILDGIFGPANEKQREFLEMAKRNADRLSRLIDTLLDLSQLEAGAFKLKKESMDLREIVRRAVADLQPMIGKQKIQLDTVLPNVPVWIEADPDRIAQVLVNFLDNALRFARRKIGIHLSVQDREGRLTVEDDGPGIPLEDLTKIFDRFAFVQALAHQSHTGLGLSIVRGIVESHGGRVWAENRKAEEGGGARFVVLLPCQSSPTSSPEHSVRTIEAA